MGMQKALTSFLLVRLVDALWASSIPFNISKFQKQLETELLCRSLVYRLVTPTTMDLAKRELAEGAPHGTVVLAEEMTSGRGRAGSKWISPDEGNLYVTIIFRSVGGQTEDQHQHLLSQLKPGCFRHVLKFFYLFFVVNLPFKEQQQQEQQQQHQHQEFCSTFGNRCCYRESGAQFEGHDSMASND